MMLFRTSRHSSLQLPQSQEADWHFPHKRPPQQNDLLGCSYLLMKLDCQSALTNDEHLGILA